MNAASIVVDTNVFVAALQSQYGASFKLFELIGGNKISTHVSVPLVLEYEDAGARILDKTSLKKSDLDQILDYICAISHHHEVYFLWRPFLKDPKDDMVLELAVAANCKFIITFNEKDFVGADKFGITVIDPKTFLKRIGELK